MAVIHALRGHSREVLPVNILGMQPLDVPRVARDVLLLQLVSGSADPSHPVLDVVEVRDGLGSVHLQLYLCDKIILYRTSRIKWVGWVSFKEAVLGPRKMSVGRGEINNERC